MRRILVTGATGFIGYELARQLSASGFRPRLLVRRPDRGALLRPLDAELVSGDLASPASLERAVQGIDTVFHLAARATFESYRLVRPSIVEGSLALARAAREAGVERFVYASSLMVYDDQSAPIDGSTPAIPRIGYGVAKLEAEEALRDCVSGGDMRLAIIRLPHVYGARSLLFESVHRGLVTLTGRGDNLYAQLHVEDASRLLMAVAARGWSGTSPVGDERPASWNEFMAVLQGHYPRVRQARLPSWLARMGAVLLAAAWRIRSRPTMTTPDTVIGWNLNLPVRPGLLWEELDLRPRYPTIDVGIPASLDDRVAFRWCHPLADPSP
jgi:nucleoside-diphosphate-sugar epimerase